MVFIERIIVYHKTIYAHVNYCILFLKKCLKAKIIIGPKNSETHLCVALFLTKI